MLKRTVHTLILSKRKELPFLILIGFLTAFIGARILVGLMYIGKIPSMFFYVTLRGEVIHVHHLSYGILIILLFGYVALVHREMFARFMHKISFLYGVGLGWIADEAALWLSLEEDYYSRISYDAVVIVLTVLGLVVYFPGFWRWCTGYLRKKYAKK